jgi:hypothetical protein
MEYNLIGCHLSRRNHTGIRSANRSANRLFHCQAHQTQTEEETQQVRAECIHYLRFRHFWSLFALNSSEGRGVSPQGISAIRDTIHSLDLLIPEPIRFLLPDWHNETENMALGAGSTVFPPTLRSI